MVRVKHVKLTIRMPRAQAGFVLPVTMITLLFFSFYVMHAIAALDLDRAYLGERKIAVTNEHLKQMAAFDLTQIIQKTDGAERSGELSYKTGRVTYEIKKADSERVIVTAHILLASNHQAPLQFLYDTASNKIVKWVE